MEIDPCPLPCCFSTYGAYCRFSGVVSPNRRVCFVLPEIQETPLRSLPCFNGSLGVLELWALLLEIIICFLIYAPTNMLEWRATIITEPSFDLNFKQI